MPTMVSSITCSTVSRTHQILLPFEHTFNAWLLYGKCFLLESSHTYIVHGLTCCPLLLDLWLITLYSLTLIFSRQAGHRLCNHIDRSMLLLSQYSQRDDDELREFCLQACEAFVMRCPDAINPHIPMVRSKSARHTSLKLSPL